MLRGSADWKRRGPDENAATSDSSKKWLAGGVKAAATLTSNSALELNDYAGNKKGSMRSRFKMLGAETPPQYVENQTT